MSEPIIQSDSGVAEIRTRCGQFRDLLTEVADIHLEVNTTTRIIEADESDWICRLWKIYLHARAIERWEIGVGVEHVMAPEIRAAYRQMSAVWKCLPPEARLEGVGSDLWSEEARKGMLATYDHPTPFILMTSAGYGGFSVDENWLVYARIILWLGHLLTGYVLAIDHLSKTLDSGVDVESRMTSVMHRMNELTDLEDFKKIAEMVEKEQAVQS